MYKSKLLLEKEKIHLTENQKEWLNNLIDNEINESKISSENEHIWALGCDDVEDATQHEKNSEELKQYCNILQKIKEKFNES